MNTRNIINNLLIILVTITPLIIIPNPIDYFYLPKIFFVYMILAIIAIVWFLNRQNHKLELNQFSQVDKIILSYLCLLIVSTMLSINKSLSLYGSYGREEGLFAIIAYILLFIIANKNYMFSEKHVKFIVLTAILVAGYGILQYFGLDPIPRDLERIHWSGRAFSTMGNPNFLGSYLTLILPLSIFPYLYRQRGPYLVSSALIYLSLLCTMTRGAWLGTIVSVTILIVYSFIYKLDKKHIIILLGLFTIITLVMNTISDGKIIGRFFTIGFDFKRIIRQTANYESGGAGRIFIWERVLKLIPKKPLFGYGLETLGIVFTENFRPDILQRYNKLMIFDKAHNEYLHIAITTGLPSLILYLYFIWNIVIRAIQNINDNIIILPLLCSVIGYLVQAFFNISVVAVAYNFWIILGILLNISLATENTNNT